MPTPPALRTSGLCKDFRGFRAVHKVDLEVAEGGIHALVGPNGAGKTTLFNLLSGFLEVSAGTIELFGRDITGLQPEQIAHLGVARSFQITSLFENLTPIEHVELALQGMTKEGFRFWRSQRSMRKFRPRAEELVEEVGLTSLADRPAGLLAYGQKRALENSAPSLVAGNRPAPAFVIAPTSRRPAPRRRRS